MFISISDILHFANEEKVGRKWEKNFRKSLVTRTSNYERKNPIQNIRKTERNQYGEMKRKIRTQYVSPIPTGPLQSLPHFLDPPTQSEASLSAAPQASPSAHGPLLPISCNMTTISKDKKERTRKKKKEKEVSKKKKNLEYKKLGGTHTWVKASQSDIWPTTLLRRPQNPNSE